jgi:alginate O-acetyltransferase complex protein AlgI
MTFQSYEYLFVFLPVVFILYTLVRKNAFAANTVICLAGLIFYGMSGWHFLFFLMASALLDFWLGKKIASCEEQDKRKRWLIISCVFNVGMLSLVKYSPWITGNLNDLMRWSGFSDHAVLMAMPMVPGISFYTFQTLSYTIDIYKREEHPRRNLMTYMSFVSFFPHLVAGPIMRSRNLLPQLEKVRPSVTWEQAAPAIFLIIWGVFKKLVLADNFGDIVNNANLNDAGAGLIFAYAFAMQVYCDFSAYTDVARGTARLFKVELNVNFLTPYFSQNPSEFWRRWHITLSTWVRDYVYIPLGGNRGGARQTMRNVIITMFLCGLWHGAGTNYIVWGLWHGALLALYYRYPLDEMLKRKFGSRLGQPLAMILMFQLVCIGWIFFRGESWQQIWQAFYSIGEIFRGEPLGAFTQMLYMLALFALPVFLTDYLGWKRGTEYPELYTLMPTWLKTAHYVVMFYLLIFLGKRLSNDFIYFQF